MKKLLLAAMLAGTFAACNNLKQNDNGAKEPEPVAPASEVNNDTSYARPDSTRK